MNDDDQRKAIENWLETTGYPLEHRVGEVMRRAGYLVRHGPHVESAEGAARETDLIAAEPAAAGDVVVVVECKHAVRPWIVRYSRNELEPHHLAGHLVAHPDFRSVLARELQEERLDVVPLVVRAVDALGFSIVEGPKTTSGTERRERDDPYRALQSVVGAARALAGRRSVYDRMWIIWPMIVVEGTLWALRDTSQRDLEPVPWIRVSWDGLDAHPTLVDVVEAASLDDYLRELREETQFLTGWIGRHPPGPMIRSV